MFSRLRGGVRSRERTADLGGAGDQGFASRALLLLSASFFFSTWCWSGGHPSTQTVARVSWPARKRWTPRAAVSCLVSMPAPNRNFRRQSAHRCILFGFDASPATERSVSAPVLQRQHPAVPCSPAAMFFLCFCILPDYACLKLPLPFDLLSPCPHPVTKQSVLMELEVLMVRVAMQLMAGHMYKAATSTRKFLKSSHWLLKVRGEPCAWGEVECGTNHAPPPPPPAARRPPTVLLFSRRVRVGCCTCHNVLFLCLLLNGCVVLLVGWPWLPFGFPFVFVWFFFACCSYPGIGGSHPLSPRSLPFAHFIPGVRETGQRHRHQGGQARQR